MNRLQLELDRLYPASAEGGARVLVFQLARPVGWERLSPVWQGVQSELELPAPAIAVSGTDGLQLWFALAESIAPGRGAAFLEGLREKYLPDVDPARVRMIADAARLPPVPPVETGPERWSAFVTPDLAAVFDDTPWLDIPPTEDGQAALLRGIQPIRPEAFEAAMKRLVPAAAPDAGAPASSPAPAIAPSPAGEPAHADPMRFLAGVMADETAPLALRIEAAKALLPYAARP